MDNETEQTAVEAPRDISAIIEEGRNAPEPTPQPEAQPAPEGQDAPTGENRSPERDGVFSAYQSEKKKRQALANRVRELEEENRALTAPKEQPETADDFWSDPENYIKRSSRPLIERAAKAEFIAEHGKETFVAMQHAVRTAFKSNHPDIPALQEAVEQSDDPVSLVYSWVQSQPQLLQPAQQQRPASVFPSNLSGARNVGTRRGPAWVSPSIEDIFNRNRK